MPLGNAGIGPGLGNSDPANQLQRMVRSGSSFSGNEAHVVFLNKKGANFKDVSSITGLDYNDDGRALCMSDWDQDGDLDVWISNRNGPQIRYFRNDIPNLNKSIIFSLVGKTCNRDAIGARVVLRTKGGVSQMRTITAGSGFLSQSTKALHFGMDGECESAELTIHWPGSEIQKITNVRPGHYVIEQGAEPKALKINSSFKINNTPKIEPVDRTLLTQVLPIKSIFSLTNNDLKNPILLSMTRNGCEQCDYQKKAWEKNPPKGLTIKILNSEKLTKHNPEILELFQLTYDHFYEVINRPIPTPVSFLVSTEGNLRAIYRGVIDHNTLLEDLLRIEEGKLDLRNLSLPFEGIWASKSNPTARPLNFVEDLLDAGKLSVAESYIASEKNTLIQDEVFPMLLERLNALKKERRP